MNRPLPESSLAYGMFTMPWARRYARRLELFGRSLGLKVQHDHDGGRTLRYHVLTATGPDWAVQKFSKTIDRWSRLKADLPVDRAGCRPEHMDDLLAKLRKEAE